MIQFQIPKPVAVPISIARDGEITFSTFVREIVFIRPAWRERGNAPLLIEIDDALAESPPETMVRWSDDAHELLVRECSFPDMQVRWDLVKAIATFQIALARAEKSEPKV